MVGILLALQVNNWNESRKNEYVKQLYLKSLIDELRNNCNIYMGLQTVFDDRITSYNSLFDNLNARIVNHDSIKNAFKLANTFIGITAINRTAFEELINSNNIQVFNKDLRDDILTYYTEIDNLIERINLELDLLRELRLEMYNSIDLAYKYGYKEQEQLKITDWETKPNSPQFIKSTNYFARRKMMLLSAKNWFNDLTTDSEEMISELEKHLAQC
jgi:hypothetical protein